MNLPNRITVIRIVLIPIFCVLFFVEFPYHYFAATGVFALASLTDFIDGHLARKLNLVTDLGKFLDSIADKMLVAAALVALVSLTEAPFADLRIVIASCSAFIICRELAISALRQIAAVRGKIVAADMFGKVKAVFEFVAIIVFLPAIDVFVLNELAGRIVFYVGFALFAFSTVLALLSAINYFVRNKEVFKD